MLDVSRIFYFNLAGINSPVMMEFIFELLLKLVACYPGAFVLSLFSKRTVKQVLDENETEMVSIVGLLVVVALVAIIVRAYHFFSTSPLVQ